MGHMGSEYEDIYFMEICSLKSSLTSHLNHSNRIRNDQVMTKILTLVQNRTLGTGTNLSVPVPVDQNQYGTGTTLFGIGTKPRKCPEIVVFLPFFHIFPPKPTQYSIHIKATPYSSCNLYSTQIIFQYLSFTKNLGFFSTLIPQN